MGKKLSIILPAYNEEKMISKVITVVSDLLKKEKIEYELIFVNDGSNDATWKEIQAGCNRNPCVKGICFSRNFGKEAAIYAGLAQSSGDAIAVMDCDLQHPPKSVIEMYRLWQQGYDVIEGVKLDRGKEGKVHKYFAGLFYYLMSKSIGINMCNASDFKLMDRKVAKILCSMPEHNTFFRALSSWVGFKTATVYFEVQERVEGISKWSYQSLIRYAINNITAFTAIPLQFVTIGGVITFVVAILLSVQTLARYINGNSVEGFTTIILLILLIGSLIMLSLGIIGFYLAKLYEEVKDRPKYIISDIISSKMVEKIHN